MWALALWLCLVTLIAPAWASDPPAREEAAAQPAPERELRQLEANLDELGSRAGVLSSDCASACEALGAMQRAVQRICELDQGPRCAAARDRVERTRRRLLEACPECLAARDERRYDAGKQPATPKPVTPAPEPPPDVAPQGMRREAAAKTGGGEGAGEAQGDVAVVESRRGGCAACAVAAPDRGDQRDALGWLLLGGALLLLRRRRR